MTMDVYQESLKRSLLNPFNIFNDILNLYVPNDDMPYISILYDTLNDLFSAIFPYDLYENNIDKILNASGIPYSNILSIMDSKNKFTKFLQLFTHIQDDLISLYIKICRDNQSKDVIKYKKNMNKLLLNIIIDDDSIASEINQNIIILNKDIVNNFSKTFKNIIDIIINVLLYPEKYKEGSYNMGKKVSDKKITEWYMDENGNLSFSIEEKDNIKFNQSVRRENRRELPKNVNILDSDSGVRLKHPKNTIETEMDFKNAINVYKNILTDLILQLNHMNSFKKRSVGDDWLKHSIKLKINNDFQENSKYFDNKNYDISQFPFKVRYLTFIISWVIRNLGRISDVSYSFNKEGRFIKYETKLSYIENTTLKVCDLINHMLKNESYGKELLYFNEIQTYLYMPDDHQKPFIQKLNKFFNQTYILSDNLKMFSNVSDPVNMDTILKLSYMASVYNAKIKDVVQYYDDFKFHHNKQSKELIIQLGSAVRKSHEKCGMPKMLEFFIKSEPLVFSRWSDVNSNIDLLMGLISLSYYSFITNDKSISKRILKIIER